MKKIVFLLSVFFIVITVYSQDNHFDEIRKIYFEELNASGASKLIAAVNSSKLQNTPLGMAYLGAAYSASAGEEKLPLGKLRKFNKGKDLLEKAVSGKPLDVEIRFLRMATQTMSPAFLGYKGDIENDKKLILLTFNLVEPNFPNPYFYRQICAFMLEHAQLTPDERAKVKGVQAKLLKK